jgi:hypothetical protein
MSKLSFKIILSKKKDFWPFYWYFMTNIFIIWITYRIFLGAFIKPSLKYEFDAKYSLTKICQEFWRKNTFLGIFWSF